MKEDKCIVDFNSKLCDIANEAFALREKHSEAKLVKKTLRLLPEQFAYKVAAIEEAKNVEVMRLDELTGSLQTFELKFKNSKKNQGIALQADMEDSTKRVEFDNDEDLNESRCCSNKEFQ